MRKIIVLGIMLLFLGMTISSSVGFNLEKQSIKPMSFGNILYVGGNGTGNYSKIQDAIDDASDGDTVFVYNGTYYENVRVNKSINLVGEDRNTTIIEGYNYIYISADWVNISGFTIRNEGGGIKINSDYNTIANNIMLNSGCDGIELDNSNSNAITDNTILNNWCYGIRLYNSTNNTIYGNTFLDNYMGINNDYSYNSTDNIIYHNNFINNTQNAFDKYNNTWDNGYPSGGNYWDDYTGSDSNGDGIGDTPYNISGGDNQDRYPLMEPYGNGDENETFFGTMGPICPLLNIAEINLIDGNSSQIQKIEKMLNNRILQFIIPRWWYINVTELNFTISYNKKIHMMPFFLRFYYATMLMENGNVTFIDKPHTVTVKGLNGQFTIFRGQPFRFRPPIFVFEGNYDEVTIELIERGRV